MYVRPRHYAHSSPVRVYLARRQYSVRLVPFTIGRAAAGVFGQSPCVCLCVLRPFVLYLSFGSGSSCIRPRVLFAYFVLRTRRIRSSHFRHVCLCSSARDRIDADVDATRSCTYLFGEARRKAERKHCFLLLLARASLSTIPRLHEKLA